MAKKVIGIILVVFSSLGILLGLFFLLMFGLFGTIFGALGNSGGLEVAAGATVETVEGEIFMVDDSSTTIYYEVDGLPYMGMLNITSSEFTEGDEITVQYDSSNPANFAAPELLDVFGVMGGIFGGAGVVIGLVFLIPSIAMLVIGIILIRKAKKEQQTVSTTI